MNDNFVQYTKEDLKKASSIFFYSGVFAGAVGMFAICLAIGLLVT